MIMPKPTGFRSLAQRCTIFLLACVCIAGVATTAIAQTAANTTATAADQQPALQEVIVTGSRIPVPASVSATSPTAVVTQQEIQLQGHTDITDVLNAMPQNIIGTNADFGNTSSPLTSTGVFRPSIFAASGLS